MRSEPDIAATAFLIADPVRSAILCALLDGGELPATELAFRAGASPQAASAHLSKLVAGRLLRAIADGRRRLFRLASPEVGHALEVLSAISQPAAVTALSQQTRMQRLREARSCYDHLAGRLGVAVTGRLIERDALRVCADRFEITRRGEAVFDSLGIDLKSARERPRSFARACMDWTERRPHLAGSLGAAVLERFISQAWLSRNPKDRALRVTPEGREFFEGRFGIRF